MRRNLELENWLIETTGEEMMANHLGPNWKRFNEDIGFYPNMTMTVADQVWQHQKSKVDELQKQKSLQELEINQIAQANQQWQLKCGELQKRVDAAIYLLPSIKAENDLWGCDQVERQIELLEQALKGDENV